MRHRLTSEQYADGIRQSDRLLLSRAITLVESRRADDQALAQAILGRVLPDAGKAIRVGITGVPGVGKSSFIETFGTYLTQLGHRLAVLAIDPTSQRSGGSLLGDKTRMETLSMNPAAYIRPSPAGDSLGGVAHHTRETMLLCEAAGFDVILVETVGVGQSETVVHGLVDFFLLLMLAGAGDELQGMKRGIVELADALVITKADGDNASSARRAQLDYTNALHLFPPTGTGWSPPVSTCSALTGEGISSLWHTILDHQQRMRQNRQFQQRRQDQQQAWFRALLRQQLDARFYNEPGMRERLTALEAQIRQGTLLPAAAVQLLLA
jgi:LAO/AO transport system kinase